MNQITAILLLTASAFAFAACSSSETGNEENASSPPPAANDVAMTPVDSMDWSPVEAALGRAGSVQAGGEYRVGMPRSDLAVTVDGVQIRTALALGSWVAFLPVGNDEAVVMGDLVLTEDEYNPVIAALQTGGIGQTAVHKHLPAHEPDLWWTHISGHGNPAELAAAIRRAIDLTGTPSPSDGGSPPPIELDTAQIHQILGKAGNANGGVYGVGFPRAERITHDGVTIPSAMGLSTAINFQSTGPGTSVVNGDFAMVPEEVDAVISALQAGGIDVVSLHNHATGEEPRLMFMHFWGSGDALELARTLRAAVDVTNVNRG